MKAFHGSRGIKAAYLRRVEDHRKADEIVKGQYWRGGKGCAVGCTIHSEDHKAYELELGIPEWLARAEDTLFEGMDSERARLWPSQFLKAINTGANLDKVKIPFVIFILQSSISHMEEAKFDENAFPEVKKAVDNSIAAVRGMIGYYRGGLASGAGDVAESAANAAWSAERGAANAAWSAADAARRAAYGKYADKLLQLLRKCK